MRKQNENIKKKIEVLDLDKKVLECLKQNEIQYVENLWILNRKKLKEIGLNDHEIKQLIIKMQLLGLDLNKKIYN